MLGQVNGERENIYPNCTRGNQNLVILFEDYIEKVHRHVTSQSNNTLSCGKKLALDNVLLNTWRRVVMNLFYLSSFPELPSSACHKGHRSFILL